MCTITVQGMMNESYVICSWTPRGRVWEGDTASQDKNFTESWVLKLFKKKIIILGNYYSIEPSSDLTNIGQLFLLKGEVQ